MIVAPLLIRQRRRLPGSSHDEPLGALVVVRRARGRARRRRGGGRRRSATTSRSGTARIADASVRDAIFRRALDLDARYHDRVGAGELISRASNDAELVARLFDSIGHTIGYILTIVGASIVLRRDRLAARARRARAAAAAQPRLRPLLEALRTSGRRSTRSELGELTSLVEETIAGHPVVKGLGAGRGARRALPPPARTRSSQTALDVADVDAVFLPALEALPLIGAPRRALVRRPPCARRRDHRRHVRALQRSTSSLLVVPLRTIGQRVSTVQRALRPPAASSDVLRRANRPSSSRRRPRAVPDASRRALRRRPLLVRRRAADPRRLHARDPRRAPPSPSSAATGSGKSTAAALLARFYDPNGGSRDDRRRRRPRAPPRRASPRCRARLRGDVPVRRHRARQRRLRAHREADDDAILRATPARRRLGVRRGPAGRATRQCSASAASRSPAASASGSRSRVPSSPTRRC